MDIYTKEILFLRFVLFVYIRNLFFKLKKQIINLIWEELINLDKRLYLFVNNLPHPHWLVFLFLPFDYLTYGGIAWIIFCISLIVFSSNSQKRVLAWWGLAIIATTFFFEEFLLKSVIFRRVRPFLEIPGAHVFGIIPHGFSFPSGQTTGSFAILTFFADVFQKRKLTILFIILATIVGISRIYLGDHYFSDILFGTLLGIVLGKIFFLNFKKYAS